MHELLDWDAAFLNPLVAFGRSEDIPPEGDLYAPFVGEWDFEWVDHKGTPEERRIPGEWLFSWTGDGGAVQDLFICPSRRMRESRDYPDTEYGTAIRIYSPEKRCWLMTYMQRGLPCHFAGRTGDGNIVLTMTDVRDFNVMWTFDDIATESFHWKNEISRDGGKAWLLLGELFAVKRA